MLEAQRNANAGNPLANRSFWFSEDGERPHPAEILFRIEGLKDLAMKSDIPEKMIPVITRMLWSAQRYKIPARAEIVEWYLLARIGKDRLGRTKFEELLTRTKAEEDEETLR